MLVRIGTALRSYWDVACTLGGEGVLGRAMFFAALCGAPLKRRFASAAGPTRLHASFGGRRFPLFIRDGADIAVLREVFVEHEYAFDLHDTPESIIDIGGHAGFASIFLSLSFPEASIRTYEPDPSNFAMLLRNTEWFPKIRTHRAAVSDMNGTADFYAGSSSISSSLSSRPETTKLSVETVTLDALLSEPADLIKFDVEGAEYRMFAASALRNTCPAYIGEVHYDLMGCGRETFASLFGDYEQEETPLSPSRSLMRLCKR